MRVTCRVVARLNARKIADRVDSFCGRSKITRIRFWKYPIEPSVTHGNVPDVVHDAVHRLPRFLWVLLVFNRENDFFMLGHSVMGMEAENYTKLLMDRRKLMAMKLKSYYLGL